MFRLYYLLFILSLFAFGLSVLSRRLNYTRRLLTPPIFKMDSLDNPIRDSMIDPSPEFQREGANGLQASPRSSSSYTLACDQSLLSRDVDRWIRGSVTPTETTGVQGSRAAVVQRSTLATDVSYQSPGPWYILAMMLPLFSINNNTQWRCSPSTILNTAEFLLSHLGRACSQVRCRIRRLTENQISREIFATAMDVVLVIYAIGFLILFMYQAAVIG